MKQEISPQDTVINQAQFIIDAYNRSENKEVAKVLLELTHKQEKIVYHFIGDGNTLQMDFGEISGYDVKLTATLYDWLDLSGGVLNPVWGVITKRLKFEGDTKVFEKVFKHDLMFENSITLPEDPPTVFQKNAVKNWKKPGKVLVVLGSPRGKNGYTYQYLNRFIKGLTNAGADVELIELGKKNVKPCIGCFSCWKKDSGVCVQKDDMNELLEKYNQADLIVYAFTLYWDTVPGILKNFIERLFCLEYPYMIPGIYKTRHPRRIKKDKSVFVFSVCGFPELSHFDSVKQYFKAMSHNGHLSFIGGIYRSACMFLPINPNMYKTYNQVLDGIEIAGETVFTTGKIDKKIKKTIERKIDQGTFIKQANKFWEYVVALKNEFYIRQV